MNKIRHFFVFVSLLLSACSGLAGEPKVIATLPPSTSPPPTVEANPPQTIPDIALGAEIFAANCTRCHGAGGEGDGQLVLAGEVPSPGNFTDPAQTIGKDPAFYYTIITNGKLESLMPPWSGSLSDAERWSVALYVYTLHYTPEQLASGAAIYARECVDCHGETGRGDGPEAANLSRSVGDLADPTEMVFLSDDHISTLVAEGAGTDMPAYQDKLSTAEIQAVVAYARSLSLRGGLVAPPVEIAQEPTQPVISTEEAQPPIAATDEAPLATEEIVAGESSTPTRVPDGASSIRITGIITNGTAGGSVPQNLPVILHRVDQTFTDQPLETIANADGSYIFENVPVRPDLVNFISTVYQERSFGTTSFTITADVSVMDFPLVIYERTDDPDVLSISTIITQMNPIDDVIEVTQEVTFVNSSDRAFTTNRQVATDRFASVDISLPVGSLLTGLQSQSRFFYDSATSILTDTRVVLPGEHRVTLLYFIPYESSAIIEFPVNYRLNGSVIAVIENEAVSLSSQQLQRVDHSVAPNVTGTIYGANLALNPGELVRFELRGQAPSTSASGSSSVITANNLLPIILIALGVAALGIAGVMYLNSQKSTRGQDRTKLIDGLVRQIAELDAQHETGQINHDLYQQRRAQLKARLAEIMDSAAHE